MALEGRDLSSPRHSSLPTRRRPPASRAERRQAAVISLMKESETEREARPAWQGRTGLPCLRQRQRPLRYGAPRTAPVCPSPGLPTTATAYPALGSALQCFAVLCSRKWPRYASKLGSGRRRGTAQGVTARWRGGAGSRSTRMWSGARASDLRSE